MNVKILILEIQRQAKPFPLQRREECFADVEVQSVAELVAPGRPASLDAGGQLTCIVRAEARAAETCQKVLQRLEAEKIDGLIRYVESDVSGLVVSPIALLTGLVD